MHVSECRIVRQVPKLRVSESRENERQQLAAVSCNSTASLIE